MENYEMSSLDIRFLVGEIKASLVNGFFRKIYQYESTLGGEKTYQFLFEIFVPGKGQQWLYADRKSIYVTSYKKPSPSKPPGFCLLLRKHLEGSKILDIRQHEFDRIVEIITENNVLVIELFSDGNIVLCTSEFRIIMPLYSQEWKDRNLKQRIEYKHPPPRINPFAVNFEYFREYISRFDRKIIAVLAAGFGFGPTYAKEICFRSKVDESIPAERLSANLAIHLFNTIKEIDTYAVQPTLYANCVSSFMLKNYEAGEPKKHFENFSMALDEFFSEQQVRLAEEFEKGSLDTHKQKYGRMLKEQDSSLLKWSEKREERKAKADLIYSNYAMVERIFGWLDRMKSSGLTWSGIKEAMKDLPDGKLVKGIDEHKAKVTVEIGGKDIELDFRRSVMENAQAYYEVSKTAKKKIAGVKEAMEKTKKKMEEEPRIEKAERPRKIEKAQKKWFEKFRWFVSSDGFLAVGGRDETSNEVLIKKYAEKNDLVFHSTIQGSPFVVVKSGGKEIPLATKKEAAEFTASYSKAWQYGLGSMDVYCVKPEQVSKQAKSGEYLAKGSFMIYGGKELYRGTELRVAIGIRVEKETPAIISGPVGSVSKQAGSFVIIRPGDVEAAELARKARSTLLIKAAPEQRALIEKIPLEEFQRLIPGGKGEIAEHGV